MARNDNAVIKDLDRQIMFTVLALAMTPILIHPLRWVSEHEPE